MTIPKSQSHLKLDASPTKNHFGAPVDNFASQSHLKLDASPTDLFQSGFDGLISGRSPI